MSWRPIATTVIIVLVAGATAGLATTARAEDGELSVVAGTGTADSAGDGGPASSASLHTPAGVAVASDGILYISDPGSRTVRAVSVGGIISTVAGSGRPGRSDAELPDGIAGTGFDLVLPQSLAVGADGTLYIADAGMFRVFALSTDRRLSTVAGTGVQGFSGDGGPATRAALGQLGGLAIAPDGTIYIGDAGNRRVRAVSPDGVITTVAGNGGEQLTAAGGVATAIPVPYANSLALDDRGDLWIADGLVLHRLRAGTLSTATMPDGSADGTWGLSEAPTWPPPEGPVNNVAAVTAHGTDVYVIDQSERQIVRFGAGDVRTIVAAPGRQVDGPFIGPIAAAPGIVYLADSTGHRVYAVDAGPGGPGPGETEDPGAVPWWPFAAGGGAIALIIVWLIVRRRHTM
jgi:sugar lactone lactonase YvrE